MRSVDLGRIVAALLKGCWRSEVAAPQVTLSGLEESRPLLLSSGAAPLAWRALRSSSLSRARPAASLHEAFKLHAIKTARKERQLRQIVSLFRSAGIEPMLVKGWAIGRCYPDSGLRPYGDFDLVVRTSDRRTALKIASCFDDRWRVDLQDAHLEFAERTVETVFERSVVIPLDGVPIRVPCPEDHLHILCVHALGHGLMRPLWLCDVAVALETRPASFDWGLCLGSTARSDWVACVIRAAHVLLGASLEGSPLEVREKPLPRWLVPTVLREWGTLFGSRASGPLLPITTELRRPNQWRRAISRRWPNPVQATVRMEAQFDDAPRLPLQLACILRQSVAFARHAVTKR